MANRREREILERAVEAVTAQAVKADGLVDEALDAGLGGSHPVTVQAKMLRLTQSSRGKPPRCRAKMLT